jgi:hypothetical protein
MSQHAADTPGVKAAVNWILGQVPANSARGGIEINLRGALLAIAWERAEGSSRMVFVYGSQAGADAFEGFLPKLAPVIRRGYREQAGVHIEDILAGVAS